MAEYAALWEDWPNGTVARIFFADEAHVRADGAQVYTDEVGAYEG